MSDELADEFLAAPVVNRGVDKVDPLVEHRVEEAAGIIVADVGTCRLSPQLHGAKAKGRDLQAGPSQRTQLYACHPRTS